MRSIPIITPKFLHLEVAATADRPSVRMRVMHNQATGAYVPTSLELEHPRVAGHPDTDREDGPRRPPPRGSPQQAQRGERRAGPSRSVKTYFRGTTGRAVSEKARNEPSDEHLENAALVYRLARLVGDFPSRPSNASSFSTARKHSAG